MFLYLIMVLYKCNLHENLHLDRRADQNQCIISVQFNKYQPCPIKCLSCIRSWEYRMNQRYVS